jgi:hypothetical protein
VTDAVMAVGTWRNNAELIADCARLGYLPTDEVAQVCDPTYGLGRFWTVFRPANLTASDLDPAKSPTVQLVRRIEHDGVEVLRRPRQVGEVDRRAGTSTGTGGATCDADYGVDRWSGARDRHDLIRRGITECVRVLRVGGHLLVKCQDQVNGGKVRWQTREFADHAEQLGCRLVDQLHLLSYRPQPPGRRQEHARRNYSTMLVCRRERLEQQVLL